MINIRKKARIRNAFDILGNQAKDIAVMNGHLNIIKKSVAQDLRGHDKKGMAPGQHFANNPEKPTKEDFQKYGSKIVGKQIAAFQKILEAIGIGLVDVHKVRTEAFTSTTAFHKDYIEILKYTLEQLLGKVASLLKVLQEEKNLLDNTGLFAVKFRELYARELKLYQEMEDVLEKSNETIVKFREALEERSESYEDMSKDAIRSVGYVVVSAISYATISSTIFHIFNEHPSELSAWQDYVVVVGTVVTGTIYGLIMPKVNHLLRTFKTIDNELQYPNETEKYYPKLVKDFSEQFAV